MDCHLDIYFGIVLHVNNIYHPLLSCQIYFSIVYSIYLSIPYQTYSLIVYQIYYLFMILYSLYLVIVLYYFITLYYCSCWSFYFQEITFISRLLLFYIIIAN